MTMKRTIPHVRCSTKGCHSMNATRCYRLDSCLRPTFALLCAPCATRMKFTRVDHSRGPYAGAGRTPAE